MDKESREKVAHLLSLLTEEDKEKDLIEINDPQDRKEIVHFLEETGGVTILYEDNPEPKPGIAQELGGNLALWYKNSNNIWIINILNIKKFNLD